MRMCEADRSSFASSLATTGRDIARMAFPPKQILPCLCSILLLLSITFFSHAKAQSCKSRVSYQKIHNYTLECVGSEFYVIDKESGVERNLSYSDVNNTRVLSTIDGPEVWRFRTYPDESFSATISYQPLWNPSTSSRGGLAFLIFPLTLNSSSLIKRLSARNVGPLDLTNPTSLSADVSGSKVSVRIGVLSNLTITEYNERYRHIIVADITIVPALNGAVANNCTVWIDYDNAGRSLSVYAEVQANPKPDSPIAEVPLKHTDVAPIGSFGLLSTAEQVRHSGVRWNATIEVEDLGLYTTRFATLGAYLILVFVAATILMAFGLAWYFNSRYRRWHKDLDQLARSMERLPGMPTKVEFSDIKKATRNFHEAMKLGGGGFGAVYRCTLPAAASKTERPMDVAVKRFTRDVHNRGYDDFLAEVSIINRLRHKNIVPLIGWSYNKGEPLLVFEFMTNGSLDQHLFPRGGGHTGQRDTDAAAIQQWATRYEIVRDVATGLHYVHHEYEPMVLHCDIKASNVMLDSNFRARLGDFGLACTVDLDRNSATGVGGTRGYIAPEYGMFCKATRQTDIYALGVLILEVVTGQQVLIHRAVDDDVHITDRVWRLHREGRLMECVDAVLVASSSPDEDSLHAGGDAERLLLLGLACSSPNPSDRPTMPEVVQVIAKSAPPPEVPLMKPRFVWPPPEGAAWDGDDSVGTSITSNLEGSMASTAVRQSQWLTSTAAAQRRAAGGHASFQLEPSVYVTVPSALGSGERPSRA